MKSRKTTVLCILLCMALLTGICMGCAKEPEYTPVQEPPPRPASEGGDSPAANQVDVETLTKVEIQMEAGGSILLGLDSGAAPISVENFIKLANEGFYDGLLIHRIAPGFVIQGGCPEGTGTGGPGYQIKGEFASNGWDNPISHTRGVVSMARSNAPDSAGSQFFITLGDATFLDGDYAAFGVVLSGMDVVDEIAKAETESERPLEDIVIKTIKVVE